MNMLLEFEKFGSLMLRD